MRSGEKAFALASLAVALASFALAFSNAIYPRFWPSIVNPGQREPTDQNQNTTETAPSEDETEPATKPPSYIDDSASSTDHNVTGGDEEKSDTAAENDVPEQQPVSEARHTDDRYYLDSGNNLAAQVGDDVAYGTAKNHQVVTDKLDGVKVERWVDADREEITVVEQKNGKDKTRDEVIVAADRTVYMRHDENGKEQWAVEQKPDGTVTSDQELNAKGNLIETIPQEQQVAQAGPTN